MWDGEHSEGKWPLWGWELCICFPISEKGKWKQTLWDRIWTRSEWRKARKRKGLLVTARDGDAWAPGNANLSQQHTSVPLVLQKRVCAWVTVYDQRGIRDLEIETDLNLKGNKDMWEAQKFPRETMRDPGLLSYFSFQTIHSLACVFA